MPIRVVLLCLAALAVVSLPALAQTEPPSVDEILEHAIATYKHNEETGYETRYDYTLSNRIEKLDDDGAVEEVEDLRYESDHLDGVAYERLVSKDGKPLDEKERREEQKRREEFERKLAEGKAKDNDADDRVGFDEALLSRFNIVFEGTESLGDRICYRLAFAPKPGKLPVERRIDRVLNKSVGSIWIDRGSYEVARVEFELTDPVRLWWGIAGSVSEMRGSFERRPVHEQDSVWLPEAFDLYMKARLLFRKIHIQQNVLWSDFEPRLDGVTTAKSGN